MYLNRIQIQKHAFGNSSFALKDVDLTFERGFAPKVFPLGGSQGCGKSTLLRLIYQKIATDMRHFDDGIVLDLKDRSIGNVHLIVQDDQDSIYPMFAPDGNFTTFDHILVDYASDVPEPITITEQKTKALLLGISDIKDSIILLDNPELGLHPDNQYNLCRDICDLKTSNQFIIATHSYEFCNALTPHHVKILEGSRDEV